MNYIQNSTFLDMHHIILLSLYSFIKFCLCYDMPNVVYVLDQQLKLVMDSIIWAFRHTERNIAETGLNLLLEMLKNFQV